MQKRVNLKTGKALDIVFSGVLCGIFLLFLYIACTSLLGVPIVSWVRCNVLLSFSASVINVFWCWDKNKEMLNKKVIVATRVIVLVFTSILALTAAVVLSH